jgi:hypothetical protein
MDLIDEEKGVFKDGHEREDVVTARNAYVKANEQLYDYLM